MQNFVIIVLIIVAVVAMVLGGWISFADMDNSATITVHKDEVKKDTEQAVKKSEEFIEDAASEGRKLIDKTEETSVSDEPVKEESGFKSEPSKAVDSPR